MIQVCSSGLALSPFLKMGDMIASFRSLGSFPSSKDLLKSTDIGFANTDDVLFRNKGCIKSGPGDLSALSANSFFRTVCSSNWTGMLSAIC